MNILHIRKFTYFAFFLTVLMNPFSFAVSEVLKYDLFDDNPQNKRKRIFNNKENFLNPNLEENFFDKNTKLVLNEPINIKKELEIQSDKQYQVNDVIYAEGNVLVTFNGNSLEADSLVYDKSNQKFDAFGNIKLNIGKQFFVAEKISYDFESQKGKLSKVKGLINIQFAYKNKKV